MAQPFPISSPLSSNIEYSQNNSHRLHPMKISYAYAAIILATALAGCASGPSPYPYSTDRDTIFAIQMRPSAYAGSTTAFRGRVLQSDLDSGILTFQMLHKYTDESILVSYRSGPEGCPIYEGDDVSVLGAITGVDIGRNAIGGVVKSIEIEAYAIVSHTKGHCWFLTSREKEFRTWEAGQMP